MARPHTSNVVLVILLSLSLKFVAKSCVLEVFLVFSFLGFSDVFFGIFRSSCLSPNPVRSVGDFCC